MEDSRSGTAFAVTNVEPGAVGGTWLTNAALGLGISQYLTGNGLTRADVGDLLGVSGQNISHKIRGRRKWTAEDIAVIAARFGVGPEDLLPRYDVERGWMPAPSMPAHRKDPIPSGTGSNRPVAGTGFEPATSRSSLQRPSPSLSLLFDLFQLVGRGQTTS